MESFTHLGATHCCWAPQLLPSTTILPGCFRSASPPHVVCYIAVWLKKGYRSGSCLRFFFHLFVALHRGSEWIPRVSVSKMPVGIVFTAVFFVCFPAGAFAGWCDLAGYAGRECERDRVGVVGVVVFFYVLATSCSLSLVRSSDSQDTSDVRLRALLRSRSPTAASHVSVKIHILGRRRHLPDVRSSWLRRQRGAFQNRLP